MLLFSRSNLGTSLPWYCGPSTGLGAAVIKVQLLHSQKRHRLDASCGSYRPDASCQQVVSSLLTSSSCNKSVNIRLAAT